jgi:hypothetical protein
MELDLQQLTKELQQSYLKMLSQLSSTEIIDSNDLDAKIAKLRDLFPVVEERYRVHDRTDIGGMGWGHLFGMSPNNLDRYGNDKGDADNSQKTLPPLKSQEEKLTEWQMARKDREGFGLYLDMRTVDNEYCTLSTTVCENTLNPSGQIHCLDFLTGIRITTE